MGSVIDMFPEKTTIPNISKLDFWRGRNLIISESFHTSSIYEKQTTLDTVLQINNELYELVLKLKGEI